MRHLFVTPAPALYPWRILLYKTTSASRTLSILTSWRWASHSSAILLHRKR